jgi:hypothetical protein
MMSSLLGGNSLWFKSASLISLGRLMYLACLAGCDAGEVFAEISVVVVIGSLGWGVTVFAGSFIGSSIRHAGSVGLDGSEEEDMGRTRTSDELSHSWFIRGEYAGVDGSESINVPKDLADIGGDIGPRDRGVIGGCTRDGGG